MSSSERNERSNSNKLLFWFVSARPRRMKINCCFVFRQDTDNDSTNNESQENPSPRRSSSTVSSSPTKKSSKRNGTSSNGRRRVIRREDIGLPFDFRHETHLGPSDLSNATSIICGTTSSF